MKHEYCRFLGEDANNEVTNLGCVRNASKVKPSPKYNGSCHARGDKMRLDPLWHI